jgi:hypothetical protein
MTTTICFENATKIDYQLSDQDGHNYGIVKSNGYYYWKLRTNQNNERQYILNSNQSKVSFWLGTNGEITQIQTDKIVYLEIKYCEQQPPNGIDPLCSSLKNVRHNKLLITPINNVFARAVVPVVHYFFNLSHGT